jgi:hypothetical protein
MPRDSTERQLARRLAIIDLLPLLPDHGTGQGATVDQLMTKLGDTFAVDRRTFERDLRDLADPQGPWRRQFGLEVEPRPSVRDGRINEWFTTAHSKIPLFKSVTAIDALVASFARQELGPLLPRDARQALDEQVATIERKQRHLHLTDAHRQAVAYQDKIRRLPDGRPVAPGKVASAHLQTVNDALMKNLMLSLVYRAAKSEVNKIHRVYAVGLVIHDRTLRLLAVDGAEVNPGSIGDDGQEFPPAPHAGNSPGRSGRAQRHGAHVGRGARGRRTGDVVEGQYYPAPALRRRRGRGRLRAHAGRDAVVRRPDHLPQHGRTTGIDGHRDQYLDAASHVAKHGPRSQGAGPRRSKTGVVRLPR